MPTSKGLSYSMNSFPRSACTIGAFNLPATSITSVWAPAHPRTAENGDPPGLVQKTGHRGELLVGGTNTRPRLPKPETRLLAHGLSQRDIAGQHHNRDTSAGACCLDRDLQDARHLLRLRHQLTIMATVTKEMFRMGLLEIPAPDSRLGMCAAIARTGTRLRCAS
jgi:hypothetical protein